MKQKVEEENNMMEADEEFHKSTVMDSEAIKQESPKLSVVETLMDVNPLVVPAATISENNLSPGSFLANRARRRSSGSILTTLHKLNQPLTPKEARKRSFLVGSGQHIPRSADNDLATCFPNGRALTVMVVTWNTGEAKHLHQQSYTPTEFSDAQFKERMLDDLCDILLPEFIESVSDLIIICTQEMPPMKDDGPWQVLLQEVIGPTHVPYYSYSHGTLSLSIFLRRDLIWFCTRPEHDLVKFRLVNVARSKASLVVTFSLFGTSLMIINSHFYAGESIKDQPTRKHHFQETINKISIPTQPYQRISTTSPSFPKSITAVDVGMLDSTKSTDSNETLFNRLVKSCDYVLWAGDLNFRLNLTAEEIMKFIEEKNFHPLLEHDEFLLGRKDYNSVFRYFDEAEIQFAPTYKFIIDSDEQRYATERRPAYTDRILFCTRSSSKIDCQHYRSIENVNHSDHKPVVAQFQIKLKPGLQTGNLCYGKFNQEIYQRGCQQREQHYSRGIPIHSTRGLSNSEASSVCTMF